METVIRVAIIYIVIYGGLRILGKREFSQLAPAELVTLLLIPELVSQALVGEDFSMTNGIIAVTTVFVLVFITSTLMHLNSKVEEVIAGKPVVIVAHGKFIDDNMNKERVSPEEVFTSMHNAGLEQLSEVKWAILENDGKIAIVAEDWGRVPAGNEQTGDEMVG